MLITTAEAVFNSQQSLIPKDQKKYNNIKYERLFTAATQAIKSHCCGCSKDFGYMSILRDKEIK